MRRLAVAVAIGLVAAAAATFVARAPATGDDAGHRLQLTITDAKQLGCAHGNARWEIDAARCCDTFRVRSLTKLG